MSRHRRKKPTPRAAPPRIELRFDELGVIIERAKAALTAADHAKLKAAMDTLAFVTAELEAKRTSLERLRLIFEGGSREPLARASVAGFEPLKAPRFGESPRPARG